MAEELVRRSAQGISAGSAPEGGEVLRRGYERRKSISAAFGAQPRAHGAVDRVCQDERRRAAVVEVGCLAQLRDFPPKGQFSNTVSLPRASDAQLSRNRFPSSVW